MTTEDEIAQLKVRVKALEDEVRDKRATDAYLFLMIKHAYEALTGMLERFQSALVGKQAEITPSAEEVKARFTRFEENTEKAKDYIWPVKDT
ncbi:hypothetical protein [Roseovarius confluentis]|uniref:hypothetical protein n=1 Tax=Roseovarius confluentis TaxID=1852027 RepID=UPI003BA89362